MSPSMAIARGPLHNGVSSLLATSPASLGHGTSVPGGAPALGLDGLPDASVPGSRPKPSQNQCHSTIGPRPMDHTALIVGVRPRPSDIPRPPGQTLLRPCKHPQSTPRPAPNPPYDVRSRTWASQGNSLKLAQTGCKRADKPLRRRGRGMRRRCTEGCSRPLLGRTLRGCLVRRLRCASR